MHLGAFFSTTADNYWPLTRTGWWPPPLVGAPAAANAHWDRGRCAGCSQFFLVLVADVDIPRAAVIRVSHLQPRPYLGDVQMRRRELTFDGSVRSVGPHTGAGAAAVMWSLPNADGTRTIERRA